MSLKGRVAVITGASRGIGRVIALTLVKQGVDLVLAAKTREPHPKLGGTLLSVKAEVEALGGKAIAVQTDVREEAQIERLRDETQKAFGRSPRSDRGPGCSQTGLMEVPGRPQDAGSRAGPGRGRGFTPPELEVAVDEGEAYLGSAVARYEAGFPQGACRNTRDIGPKIRCCIGWCATGSRSFSARPANTGGLPPFMEKTFRAYLKCGTMRANDPHDSARVWA